MYIYNNVKTIPNAYQVAGEKAILQKHFEINVSLFSCLECLISVIRVSRSRVWVLKHYRISLNRSSQWREKVTYRIHQATQMA